MSSLCQNKSRLEGKHERAYTHNMSEEQVLVAMKGHPGTGKSTLARAIAKALKVPLIDKDDISDSTHSLNLPKPQLNHLSYRVIYRLARTQLQLGLSLVLDSPLSNATHFSRLQRLAASSSARLLIVQCVPRDQSEWRRRLENRVSASSSADHDLDDDHHDYDDSHKPATWQELEALIESYGGQADFDTCDVPKLVVDTTEPGWGLPEQVSAVLRFIEEHTRWPTSSNDHK
ncbi:hypothetical protein Scep_013464 [Stephania cephalantha]|uniref:P-loop containing nucleoside triphosphate hydrolase protein n=1 Tax=Stephania cephalantha TaxID=152367 RepID=A0AAP0JIC7_9MAGN